MIYTTLKHIREHNPCTDGWRKLLTHLGKNDPYAPLAYSTILESNGLDDALWCLRAEPQHASIWCMYAVRCARRVQHPMTNSELVAARAEHVADFMAMLAAHHAMPGESCALVDWWQGDEQ